MINNRSGFEVLKSMDIKEISAKTNISITKIEAILNKRFDALDRASTIGFVRIIEKELKISLSDFMNEYDEYQKAQQKDGWTEKPLFKIIKEDKKPKSFGIKIVLLAIIGAIFYYTFTFGISSLNELDEILPQLSKLLIQEDTSATSKQTITSKTTTQQTNAEQNDTALSEPKQVDENATLELLGGEMMPNQMQIAQTPESINQSLQNLLQIPSEQNQTKKQEFKKEAIHTKSITIFPNERVWLGAIFLDSGTKINRFIETPYSMDTSRRQLIVLGKGVFSMDINGSKKDFLSPNPIRFIYEKESLRQISYEEFMEINGGKIW